MSAEQLQRAIEYLIEESDGRKPQVRVDNAIREVERVAKQQGLSPSHIDVLMDFVSGQGRGSASSRNRVIRCLIPRTSVPCSAILKALGCVKSLPLSVQLLLFRWIVLVFDLIDDRTALHCVYSVVFYHLQVDDLRSTICQLLCYLTRREDVLEFRVQKLMELQKRVLVYRSVESSLVALLAVYKTYRPHLVSMALPSRRKVWFRPFEKALAANIKRIQELNLRESHEPRAAEKFQQHVQLAPPPAKRARREVHAIPSLHSSLPPPSSTLTTKSKVSVSQLASLSELCENITKLELPGQMASVLESHLLRHLLSIWSDPSAALRLTYWLHHVLGYELDEYSAGSESPQLGHLLTRLVQLTDFILEPIPTVESFLSILLEVWNGDDYRTQILQLLTHLSLLPFEDLEDEYLEHLKQLFVSKDTKFRCACLTCLTGLLRNWVTLEWPRHQRRADTSHGDQEDTLQHRSHAIFFLGSGEEEEEVDPVDTMRMFVKYCDHLIALALEKDRGHALIHHAATSFYELVVELPAIHGISLISLPHNSAVYRSLLSADAVSLSRTCALLVCCKQNLSKVRKSQRDLQITHTFNSIILDFCDGLWRNLAFSNDHRPYPTLLFQIPREVLESCGLHSTHDRLSIIHHPALLGFVHKFFQETQETTRGLQPNAIWQENRFKEAYLEFLKRNGLHGLVDFIRTFVRSRT